VLYGLKFNIFPTGLDRNITEMAQKFVNSELLLKDLREQKPAKFLKKYKKR